MRKIRKKKKGHAARLKRIKKCIKLKCRMIRRKKKGRNDATEGRGISTRGGEREKMQEEEEEEELQTMDKNRKETNIVREICK